MEVQPRVRSTVKSYMYQYDKLRRALGKPINATSQRLIIKTAEQVFENGNSRAALINVGLREMADSGEFGEMRGTMGVVRPEPGAINVIPGRAQVTVDLRNPDDGQMSRAERAIKDRAAAIAEQHGVELEWRQTARTSAVSFDESVQQVIADAADAQGLRHQRLIAGAGHDAQEWARICKTAMIFVPGEDDGISHNPRELSTARQCADGANILLQTLLRLLNEP